MSEYDIITVPRDASNTLESVGSKQKFWYYRDEINDKRPWLFKANRPGTGEDWSEKVAAELCALLGLPHVGYELATWTHTPGVVSRRLDRDDETLVLGNVVLSGRYAEYPLLTEEVFARIREHTLDIVLGTLDSPDLAVQVPPEWVAPTGIETSSDVFVGYLLLDAWIGNTDRHDKNWGLVERLTTDGVLRYLAPTFDHASSMGREVTDDERRDRLGSKDRGRQVEAYASRARSALFHTTADRKPMHPILAFQRAAQARPRAASTWLEHLRSVSDATVEAVIERIPAIRMTDHSRTFALRVLNLNRATLLGPAPEL